MPDLAQKTPEQQAQNALKSALDSVTLVNQLVTANTHNEQIDKRVEANYQHLQIVLDRQNVKDYIAANTATEATVTAMTEAIAAGKAFLGK